MLSNCSKKITHLRITRSKKTHLVNYILKAKSSSTV